MKNNSSPEITRLKENTEHVEWNQIIYQKTWELIMHEDNLMQTRNQTFLTILTILLSAGTAITSYLLMGFKGEGKYLNYQYYVVAAVVFTFSLVSFFILLYWKGVTKASQEFINNRRLIVRIIEEQNQVKDIGVALNDHYHYLNRSGNYIGGYESNFGLIKAFQVICYILCLLSIILVIYASFFSHVGVAGS